jgi:hypothetical protein
MNQEISMGMAHRAPDPRYNRKHVVSHHALERFRERVEEDLKARPNSDLSNLLDEKVCQATNVYTVRDPRAPDEVTTLAELDMRSGVYYAVVRSETIITVLDESMVKENYNLSYQPALNASFATDENAKKLRELQTKLQQQQPRKLSPRDQAILTGAIAPPTPPGQTPLETAGVKHAIALKRYRDCELAVARLKEDLAKAEAALQEAGEQRAAATAALTALIEG